MSRYTKGTSRREILIASHTIFFSFTTRLRPRAVAAFFSLRPSHAPPSQADARPSRQFTSLHFSCGVVGFLVPCTRYYPAHSPRPSSAVLRSHAHTHIPNQTHKHSRPPAHRRLCDGRHDPSTYYRHSVVSSVQVTQRHLMPAATKNAKIRTHCCCRCSLLPLRFRSDGRGPLSASVYPTPCVNPTIPPPLLFFVWPVQRQASSPRFPSASLGHTPTATATKNGGLLSTGLPRAVYLSPSHTHNDKTS